MIRIQMTDALLSKPELPEGFIDCSVGEAHIVREKLFEVFDCSVYELPKVPHMYEYPPYKGYKPLVQLLENKHGYPVIITNGAKQGLAACFYVLKQKGWNYCQEKSPHWALIPPLAEMHGIEMVHANGPSSEDKSPFLLISPNNPDGHCESPEELKRISQEFKDSNLPLIHDAAYYTHSYLPGEHTLPSVGDVQIYSFSKMLGLSGLRLGYVVCRNEEFYKIILQYMERMTVGVSMISQIFLHDLLHRMHGYPTLTQSFEGKVSLALDESKKIIQQVDPEILEIPLDVEKTPGMFGWFKVGPKADFFKSKVNMIDGAHFGVPGHIRMNLAFNAQTILDIVKRLNSVKEVL